MKSCREDDFFKYLRSNNGIACVVKVLKVLKLLIISFNTNISVL